MTNDIHNIQFGSDPDFPREIVGKGSVSTSATINDIAGLTEMATAQTLTISSGSAVDEGISYISSTTQITGAVKATGTVVFSVNPSANDTVTLNGVAITFKASAPTGNQVLIGSNLTATLINLLAFLNATAEANLLVATYAVNATTLTITYKKFGTGGNAYTIVASVATPSGATLAGGVNGAGQIVYSAQIAVDDTITLGSVVFTIVASGATGNQINLGASLSATIDNMVTVLNASTDTTVAKATYSKVSTTTLKVTYDDATDNGTTFLISGTSSGSTGARTVLVRGLDENWNLVQEIAVLRGQTAVTLTKVKLHPFLAQIMTAGTGATNAGIIYVGYGTVTTGVPATKVIGVPTTGVNQSRIGFMPVPNGYKAILVKAGASSAGTSAGIVGGLYKLFNGVWTTGFTFNFSTTYLSYNEQMVFPSFPPKTLIKMIGTFASATVVEARASLILQKLPTISG